MNEICCHYWLLHIQLGWRGRLTLSFAYFGFQTLGETFIFNNQCYMNRQTERQMIVSIDSWYSLSMKDIRRMEKECMDELKEKIKNGSVSQALAVFT